MAVKAKGKKPNGAEKLKSALKSGDFDRLYLITGDESYLKEYYLKELKQKVVDDTFREFNLVELEGKSMTPEALNDAIESYPAMSERKLVIVTDFDLYKAPAPFQPILETILEDLPDYICLVFYWNLNQISVLKYIKNSRKPHVLPIFPVWKNANSLHGCDGGSVRWERILTAILVRICCSCAGIL